MKNNDLRAKLSASLRSVAVTLAILGFTAAYTTAAAGGNPQSPQKKVDISMSDASLEEVLLNLKEKTGYLLLYNSNDVRNVKGITIRKTAASTDEVMREALRSTNLEYSISDDTIIIRTKQSNQSAQQAGVVIRGKVVTASSKQPISGVAVYVKGTSASTITDAKGEFTLKLEARPQAPLVFSFLGMESTEVTYAGQKTLYVELKERAQSIEDVIVSTGYQQIDRRMLTSSVSSISGEKVLQSNALTIDNMLQGRIPGMLVMNSTSTPGASTSIRVRGTSTISGSHEPLWVIDGVIQDDPIPLSTEELNNLDNVNLIGNAISGLNPMDIERIDVLKDASATAIYGARSANGVIVITTKKGKRGDPNVNYSGTFSFTERPSYNKLHRMNSAERIDVSREIEQRGLVYSVAPAAVGYERLLYDLYDRKIGYTQFLDNVRRLESTNTDWFDMLYKTSFTQKHSVSISGATDKLNYYASGSYSNDRANLTGTGVEQYNAFMKLQANLRSNLDLTVQMRGNVTRKEYLYSDINAYSYAFNTSRAIPAFNDDGSYAYYNAEQGYQMPLGRNILNDIDNSGRDIDMNSLNIAANLAWTILPGLRATGSLSINSSSTHDKEWFGERSYMAAKLRQRNYGEELPEDDNFKEERCLLPYGGKLKNDETRGLSYIFRAQIDYNKAFDNGHLINLAGGTEAKSTQYQGIGTTEWGYMPDRGERFVAINPYEWKKYNSETLLKNPNVVTNRLTNFVSLYAIATYSFDSRYIFNANVRADGSNKFGQDKSARFLPIWSLSGRWNIHNEALLKNVMWLNGLSLRTSYGTQGNVSENQNPNMILNVGTMDPVSGEYFHTLGSLPNPFLKWERTNSFNIGIDFSILNNRLSGAVDYYYKKGYRQITTIDVPQTIGVSSMTTNAGNVMNKGYELIINAVPVRAKDFTWSLTVNGAKNTNKVTKGVREIEYTYRHYANGSVILKDYALNSFFSYRFDRLDANGLPTFLGTEEKDGITEQQLLAEALIYSGNRVPDIQGGFGTNIRYKNLSLNLFFSYSLGSKIRLNNLYENEYQKLPSPQQNMSKEFVNRWRKPGDEAWAVIPTLSTASLSMSKIETGRKYVIASNLWQMYNQSDLRVVTGDFLRLRTASLQYNLPEDFCKRIGFKGASVRAEGNNLWLLASDKLNGQDPEQMTFGGLGGGTTPPVSTFSLGINISF